MDQRNLKPAGTLAQFYGVKVLAYGGPGSGKTPVTNTAPRPVMLVCEPGMLSMRGSTVPAFEAQTVAKIDEFMKWFFESHEAKNFDTLAVDSISQMAEIYTEHMMKIHSHGLKAYGEMSTAVMKHINKLFYHPQKHLYLICKQTTIDEGGAQKRKPYFPGKDLNVKIPHLFDEILHLGMHTIPNVIGQQKAFCAAEQFDVFARDRSGQLNAYEPPNLSDIFAKCMKA
jgi:hypothetical protein